MLFIVILLMFVPTVVFAQAKKDERDLSGSGAMSEEELRQEPITFELDVPYADTGNPRHWIDIYLPKNRGSDTLPVIVFLHDGGWMQGDKSDGAGRLMPFVRGDEYAGVSVAYRLSGEVQWPAQIHNRKAAILWLRANASKYGLDADHIGVWGRSAGSHLALMLGVSGDVPDLEGDLCPHQDVSSQIAAVSNFFSVSEMLAIIGQPSDIDRAQPISPEAALIGGPLLKNTEKAKSASPITYIVMGERKLM